MPNQKITNLPAITVISNDDVLAIVDVNEDITKKITITQIKDQSPVQSVAGRTGIIVLTKSDVSLQNVDNTSDASKPISTDTQTALNGKQNSLGFTPENVANKSTSVVTDQTSNTKYPSVKSVYDWAIGLFASIANLDLKTNKLVVANRQTASYTLVLADADKLVEMNVATANNLTIPLNSSVPFAIGTQILLAQYGAGQTTLVPTSGVTVRSNGAKIKLNVQYSGATLIKIATDEWYLFGDIA